MAYRAEHLMMVAAILLTMILYMEAAPRSGRCTYTAEDWEDIIFTKCGRRSKRSTDTTLSLAVKGEICSEIWVDLRRFADLHYCSFCWASKKHP